MTKLTKKLLLSIMTLVLVFMALGTTTFAWFSMNTNVTVTGFEVKTKVGNNLFIAEDTADNTVNDDEDAWVSSLSEIVGSTAANKTYLEPASTINGLDFFYTTAAKSTGEANEVAYNKYDPDEEPVDSATADTFDLTYGLDGTNETGVAYFDYAFQLKGVNTSSTAEAYINLTNMRLVYNGDMTDPNVAASVQAFRAAIFYKAIVIAKNGVATATQDFGTDITTGIEGDTDKADLIKATGASYFTSGSAVSAVDTISTLDFNTGFAGIKVDKGETVVVKMVIRLWLEGEDQACTSDTFLDLDDEWVMNFSFAFESSQSTPTTMSHTQLDLSANNVKLDSSKDYDEYLGTNQEYFGKRVVVDAETPTAVYYVDGGEVIEITKYCILPTTALTE